MRAYARGVEALLGPVAAAVVVVGVDLWVFRDAQRWARAGTPVEFRLGALSLRTPASWFVACLVLWVFFVPTYLVARRA